MKGENMKIRQDFNIENQLPPRMFLEQIMPPICKAYCFLWDKKDKNYRVSMSWGQIGKSFNKNTFRSSLRKLNNEGLVSYEESIDGVEIELVSWDEIQCAL